jgi:hypothetical protein
MPVPAPLYPAVSSRRAGRSAALGELLPPMAPFGLTLAAPLPAPPTAAGNGQAWFPHLVPGGQDHGEYNRHGGEQHVHAGPGPELEPPETAQFVPSPPHRRHPSRVSRIPSEPLHPRHRHGQDKNERHLEQAHAELLPDPPAAHPGSTGTIILRSSALRVLHGRLRSVTSRDEPGLIGPASRRTRIPARARHHQSR